MIFNFRINTPSLFGFNPNPIKLLVTSCFCLSLLFIGSLNESFAQSKSKLMLASLDKLNARQYKAAIRGYNKAIKLNSYNYTAYYYRAFAWAQMGEIDSAVVDLQKSIELKPDDGRAYGLYGQVFLSVAEDDKETIEIAIWAFTNAIKHDSTLENIYSYRAEAKFRIGNKPGCCEDLEKAVKLGEPLAEILSPKYCGNELQGGESLMLHYPEEENWKLVNNAENEETTFMELVRNNETLENWTEIATSTAYKRVLNMDLEKFMHSIHEQLTISCPDAKLTFLEKDLNAEFPWIIYKIECASYTDDKTAESQLWYVVQGKTSLYGNFRAIKEAMIPDMTQKKWVAFFKTGKIGYTE